MDLFFHPRLPQILRKDSVAFLAFLWTAGLVSGTVSSFYASNSFFSLMRRAALSPVSIVGLLSAMLLPLLFSAFAVYFSASWLLIPTVFLKGFTYAYFSFGTLVCFGSAGWLIHLLLIFSDTLMLPVLWMYWIRVSAGGHSDLLIRTVPAASAALLIGSLDFSVVSPLMAEILSF